MHKPETKAETHPPDMQLDADSRTDSNLATATPVNPVKPSEIPNSDVRRALDIILRDSMRTVAIGLGFLFTALAVAHATTLPPEIGRPMTIVAAVTAALLFTLNLVLRRWALPPAWSNPLAMAMGCLVLANSLLHLYLESDPIQTTNPLLLILGAGYLFFSSFWFFALITVTIVGWLLVALPVWSEADWGHFGFAMFSALALSVIVHLVRRHSSYRMQRLRLQDEQRQADMEVALEAARSTRFALETTIEVAQRIVSILDIETLLNEVAELIKERYGHYYVGIFLLDESKEYVVSRAGTGEAGRTLCEEEFRLKVGSEGLIGWVAAHRQPLCVEDVSQDARYVQVDVIPDTHSEAVFPLIVGDTMLGVLDIQSDEIAAFKEDDILVLQSLAGQVATAIQNASVYEVERSRRLLSEKLYDIGRALSRTLNLQEVLNLILKQLNDIVPYDRVSVMLQSGSGLTFAAEQGFPEHASPLQVEMTIKEGDVFYEIYRTKRPLLVSDVSQRDDWQYLEGLTPARVWLGVPLIRFDDVVGMLSITRTRPEPYTEDEIALASTFAGQAAIALENARLYESITRFNQQLQERTKALRTAYEQLALMDRTKSNFINMAAHELRTPLTVLRGYSQILVKDEAIKQKDYHLELVKGIITGATRLQEIVDSLLEVAKIDSQAVELYPEPVSLADLVGEVVEEFEDVLQERKLTLVVEEIAALPKIEADPAALRKVFTNLISNAIKYTPDDGIIIVTGKALAAGEEDMPQGGVELVVSDTGIGIDPRYHELIFSKFYQAGDVALHSTGKTKFKGGGPGLGLPIVRGLVEAHGGHVWVESPGYDEEACPGSKFHVALPIRSASTASPRLPRFDLS